MHKHTESSDSVWKIRTNPLNIRSMDGTDLVFQPDPVQQTVVSHKPRIDMSPVHKHVSAEIVGASPTEAEAPPKLSYDVTPSRKPTPEAASVASVTSVPSVASTGSVAPVAAAPVVASSDLYPVMSASKSTEALEKPVEPLKLPKRSSKQADLNALVEVPANSKSQPEPEVPEYSAYQDVADLDIMPTPQLSLGHEIGSLADDFASFSLSRKPTISTRVPSAKAGPSRSPELIQRLRSIRKQKTQPQDLQDEELFDEPQEDLLPAGLLKVLAMSPNAAWPSSDEEADDEEAPEAGPITGDLITLDTPEPQVVTETNPFKHSPSTETEVSRETTPAHSVGDSVTTVEGGEPKMGTPMSMPTTVDLETSPVLEEAAATPTLAQIDPVSEDDRGRLFMQINKIGNIRGLALDMSRNPRFTITLDNGIQTVTTPAIPLPSTSFTGVVSANIGQEFELLVAQDLELIITINVYMDVVQPPARPRSIGIQSSPEQAVQTPPESPKTPKKRSVMKFLSPKRKKEKAVEKVDEPKLKAMDAKYAEEQEYERSLEAYRRKRDMWKNSTGPDGELARGYLFESHYEREIFGEARSYSLPLYNEWVGEDPRHTCDLQLTLMYVPKLFASEEIPTSLKECQQELRIAAENRHLNFDGFLTQNGGDCAMWRRRWFTLRKNELTGHHEATRKERALIYMENAVSIVDAKDLPVDDETMFIYKDQGFRISFKDGEQLNFYADTVPLKDQWMHALRLATAFNGQQRRWTDLVLDHHSQQS